MGQKILVLDFFNGFDVEEIVAILRFNGLGSWIYFVIFKL